jgi:hypothetical protein
MLDVEMAHPTALDAFCVTGLRVFSDQDPPKLTAMSALCMPLRKAPFRSTFHQCPSEHRQNQQRDEKNGHSKSPKLTYLKTSMATVSLDLLILQSAVSFQAVISTFLSTLFITLQ